ncbi:unnamed protein product [Periconia digitata]|uniref:Uncharacterized protein n=1 Tax=Periconia digitata TaxID=1303443 RepID=A0A9W4U9Z0_9PLEO|nr:unnamed protein product [Periconia digitata]
MKFDEQHVSLRETTTTYLHLSTLRDTPEKHNHTPKPPWKSTNMRSNDATRLMHYESFSPEKYVHNGRGGERTALDFGTNWASLPEFDNWRAWNMSEAARLREECVKMHPILSPAASSSDQFSRSRLGKYVRVISLPTMFIGGSRTLP